MSKKNTGFIDASQPYSFDLTGNATVVAGSITSAKMIAPRSGYMMVNFSVRTGDSPTAAAYVISCIGATITVNAGAEVAATKSSTKMSSVATEARLSGSFIMPVVKGGYYGLVCATTTNGAIATGYAIITFI